MKKSYYLKVFVVFLLLCFLETGCSIEDHTANYLFPAQTAQTLKPLFISETGKIVEVSGLEETSYFNTTFELTENGYLYPAKKGGVWGYIDVNGQWIIEPQFLYCMPFHNGYAQVLLSNYENAYIDPCGEIRIKWGKEEVMGSFEDDIAIKYQVTEQDVILLDFLNAQGNVIATKIPVDKSSLDTSWYEMEGQTVYFEHRCFSEGLLLASLDGKYGYLDMTGEWVIEPKYEDAQPFSEGLAAVCLNGKYGYIDHSGNEVVPCIYERAQSFSEGLGAVKLDNGEEWAWQFINPDGSVVFQFEHRCFLTDIVPDTLRFREGLCCTTQADHWTYYNKNGDPVIQIKALKASPFQHGLAYVEESRRIAGYIDVNGNWVYQWDNTMLWDIYGEQNNP